MNDKTAAPTELTRQAPGSTPPANRSVRVFISSTFRDMQAERDELVKRIFPQLRKLCEQRNVTWAEVDLRWGITKEETAEGKVLPICLAEIQECRPYFIGLLGERYGWVVDQLPGDLIGREPWLDQFRGRSVTELEILHGVLNNPAMAGYAFFYFRDAKFVNSLPRGSVRRDFEAESTEHRQKLAELKERIRKSRFPVHEGFRDSEDLGARVLADLTQVIDQRFPTHSQPNWLDRESAEHEAFARARAQVFVGRDADFLRLDEQAKQIGLPLVILGPSGAGKTSLLANWALHWRAVHPDDFVLTHFVGATPTSSDWVHLVRRVLAELKRHCALPGDVPERPSELLQALPAWLQLAATRRRIIVLLDALNQLDNGEGARDLHWLPGQLPDNCKLIVSTLPGDCLDELQRRGCPAYEVLLLDSTERARLCEAYLKRYSKTLNRDQLQQIIEAPQTANPLFLRTLLEEIRVHGSFESLNQRIGYYLAAQTPKDLFKRVLARCEADCPKDQPKLVEDSMRFIWGARRGVSEAELLELLGQDGQPLPRVHWSTLSLTLETALLSRSGLLNFAHDYFRQAVEEKYLSNTRQRVAVHRRLADYFEKRQFGRLFTRQRWGLPYILFAALYLLPCAGVIWFVHWQFHQVEFEQSERILEIILLVPCVILAQLLGAVLLLDALQIAAKMPSFLGGAFRRRARRKPIRPAGALPQDASSKFSHRVLEELPWHLARANKWWRAYDLFARPEFFCQAWEASRVETANLWRAIESGTLGAIGGRFARTPELKQIYRDVFGGGVLNAYRAVLQNSSAFPAEAPGIAQLLLEHGLHQQAFRLFDAIIDAPHDLADKGPLAEALLWQATNLQMEGYSVGAMAAFRRAESLLRGGQDPKLLFRCLNGQAGILCSRGGVAIAKQYLEEAETLNASIGENPYELEYLTVKARLLRAENRVEEALALLADVERRLHDSGNNLELLRNLGERYRIVACLKDSHAIDVLRKRITRLCVEQGINDPSPYLEADDLANHVRQAHFRVQEQQAIQAGNVRGRALVLAELGYLLAVNCQLPIGGLPLLIQAKRTAQKQHDKFLLAELEPLIESARLEAAQAEKTATQLAKPRYYRPLAAALLFGGFGLGIGFLAVGFLLNGGSSGSGVSMALAPIVGITAFLFLLAATRRVHLAFKPPAFFLFDQGIVLRRRAPGSESALFQFLYLFRPFWKRETRSILWPALERLALLRARHLLIQTADEDIVIKRMFRGSPKRWIAKMQSFTAKFGPDTARGGKVAERESRFARLVYYLAFPAVMIPFAGPLFVLALAWIAGWHIRKHPRKLLGLTFVGNAYWIASIGLLVHVAFLLPIFLSPNKQMSAENAPANKSSGDQPSEKSDKGALPENRALPEAYLRRPNELLKKDEKPK